MAGDLFAPKTVVRWKGVGRKGTGGQGERTTFSGRPVVAARRVIEMELVFVARMQCGGAT